MNFSSFSIRRALAVAINHFMGYLNFSMVMQKLPDGVEKIIVIGVLWISYLIAMIVSILIMKNRTFGDAIMKIEYVSLDGTEKVGWRVLFRMFLGSTLIYGNLLGLSFFSIFGVIIWVYLIFYFKLGMSEEFETVIDWITQIKPKEISKNVSE